VILVVKYLTTYIQSGNVIFDCTTDKKANILEYQIQETILKTFGFEVPVIIRSVDELKEIISSNPLNNTDKKEGLYLTFLKESPVTDNLEEMTQCKFDTDKFKIIGKNIFINT